MTPDVERQLLDYLSEGRVERLGIAKKVDSAADAVRHILDQLVLHEQKDDFRHAEVMNLVRGQDARITALERNADDTGRHNVEELRTKLKEKDAIAAERTKWWARWGVQLVTTAIFTIFVGLVSTLVTIVVTKGK